MKEKITIDRIAEVIADLMMKQGCSLLTAKRLAKWTYGKLGDEKVWFRRSLMVGRRIGRKIEIKETETIRGPVEYYGFMFYWLAVFYNRSHPTIQLEGERMPWKGISIYYRPNPYGKPEEKLWLKSKMIQLGR